jgi:hypothetical protein
MTDQRDPRIRALIVELSESSPEAPTFTEIEDAAIEQVGDRPVGALVDTRPGRIRGWRFGVAAAAGAVALLLIGGPLLLLRDSGESDIGPLTPVDLETTVTAAPTTVASTTSTVSDEAPSGVVWTAPADPVTLTLDPAVVPAEIGTVTVTVTGRSYDDIWVMVCRGAHGFVDPADWPTESVIAGEACGNVSSEDGTLVNPTIEGGVFTATLQVPIDAQAIEDGGVVIATGDIGSALRGNALLQITDGPEDKVAAEWLDTVDPAVTTAPPAATTTIAAPSGGSSGTFGWERHDVGELITHAAPWRDGYVALRGDRVASSADGITWEEWPEQPFDELTDRYGSQLALTIDDGDVVVVVAEPGDRLRAFASQGDEPWRNLTFEPGEVATDARALAVIVNRDDGVYVRLKATYLRQGDSFIATPLPEDLVYVPSWNQVAHSWNGITLPEYTRALGEKDGRFTAFTWPSSGETWTSTDRRAWQSIEPVRAPWTSASCGPSVPAITPEVVETGGLGWFAVGSFCAPTVVWYSTDGVQWQTIDNIEGLSGFDIWVPFAPSMVVDDRRVLIYGNLDDDTPGRPNGAVWIGTPQTDN